MRGLRFLIISLVIVSLSGTSFAGPYMAGYFSGSATTTYQVIFDVNFAGTDSSQIPSNKWLGAVLSVAGGSGLTPSGWIYQNGVILYSDNDVNWAPQAWYGSSRIYYQNVPIGDGNYVAFYERIDKEPGEIKYRAYVYRDPLQYDRDIPTIYSWDHPTNDNNFIVGTQYHNGKWFKHLQFGVEGNSIISETQWKELNEHIAYYNGYSWRYLPAYVTYGSVAYITWIGDNPYKVGGQTYTGVNLDYSSSDRVKWKYTGSTIRNEVTLWSGNGYVSDSVSKPYQ
ncbi:MAG: hypothetical protein H0Z28_12260 [Archaeoglobus sp.]|nr:hypothetical protein [Archaeoglobus sp.]